MPIAGPTNSIAPSEFYSGTLTMAGADFDLMALGGGPCREIRFITAGTLVVKRTDGINVTLDAAAETTVARVATRILAAGSTAGLRFEVAW